MDTLHLAVLAFVFLSHPVLSTADPPPGATVHAWRKQHDPNYVGYTGKRWARDYGVLEGTCNNAAVGAILGGVAGHAAGSRVNNDRNRPVAILVGTELGAMIGANVAVKFDVGDRGCMGHVLELAKERETVVWANPATGVSYQVTPTRNVKNGNKPCREFTTLISNGKRTNALMGVACRSESGEWTIRS